MAFWPCIIDQYKSIEFKISVGRPLTAVPLSTAAPTATKFRVSFASGVPSEGYNVSYHLPSRKMQRRCLGIDLHRLSPCPYRHIVYDHLVRNYVTSVVETTFSRGAQIPGVGSLGRLNFCPLAPVVGSRYGFALFHPYGARMLKSFLCFWKISAPSPRNNHRKTI
jgi:hypothetical protein